MVGSDFFVDKFCHILQLEKRTLVKQADALRLPYSSDVEFDNYNRDRRFIWVPNSFPWMP